MNRASAKKIAANITRDQLSEMMDRAKRGVRNWESVSSVNPYLTKGAAWNIFYPVLKSGRPMSMPAMVNMVWEFGDYLAEDLKPNKSERPKAAVTPHHEEPIFGGRM
jgi:hypothetical protein